MPAERIGIQATTTVFIFFTDERGRIWVSGTETRRDRFGSLILAPILDDEARNAMPWRFDLAQVAARRFATESFMPSHYQGNLFFALQASDSAEAISFDDPTPTFSEDRRTPMVYRQLVAVPGNTPQGPKWFVRLEGIESLSGNSPEEVIDHCFELGLQDKATDKYEPTPAPPSPAAPQPNKFIGRPRVRPGAFHE